ncbi:LysE family translocator [Pseudovibrio sp. SPO723]|uniref:LysE family translocator n=1 Tax=Nesiotobacter zosterae TaxID=392721 RepID=UPI0029C59C87|nr:LysE family translocator [Pseudovibrio sp. SPO723]MDX5593786.1 LysE family translocator [Pseudovibrio sp. SPO723]
MDFIPNPATLAAFSLAGILLALTPGPDMMLFLSKTLTQNKRAGVAAILGASSGVVVHSLAAALGLSALMAASATAFTVLKYIGAAYLVYLAVAAVRSGTGLSLDRSARPPEPLMKTYLQGLTINLLNPKIILFFVTFLPQFISVGDPNATGKLLFLGLYFLCLGLPCCLLMVLCADRIAKRLKSSPKAMRVFDWAFAGLMGGFALKLLTARAIAS